MFKSGRVFNVWDFSVSRIYITRFRCYEQNVCVEKTQTLLSNHKHFWRRLLHKKNLCKRDRQTDRLHPDLLDCRGTVQIHTQKTNQTAWPSVFLQLLNSSLKSWTENEVRYFVLCVSVRLSQGEERERKTGLQNCIRTRAATNSYLNYWKICLLLSQWID